MSNVLPFRQRKTETDIQHVTRALFAAMSVAGKQDAEQLFKEFRRQHPEILDVDVRAASRSAIERCVVSRSCCSTTRASSPTMGARHEYFWQRG